MVERWLRQRVIGDLLLMVVTGVGAAACVGGGGAEAADPPAANAEPRRSRDELAKEWQLYARNDEKWPAARALWLAGPPVERALLLDNLMRELMSDDAASRGSGTAVRSTRARHELTWFGSEAIGPLADGLRALGSRDKIDSVVIGRIAEALAEMRAATELTALAAPDPAGKLRLAARLAALRALATIEEPAVSVSMITRLRDDSEWEMRAAAAELLLRRNGDPKVHAALLQALTDGDGFVRAKAVRALVIGLRVDAESVPLDPLVGFLLHDPAPAPRAAAAEALALYAFEPRVEAALCQALRDTDLEVVGKTAQSLLNSRTKPVQAALVDALERMNQRSLRDASAAGLVSELLRILAANIGGTPVKINPAGWRALIEERARRQ